MSYALGTKVRLVKPWRAYGAGFVMEQGFEVDLETLVRGGMAELVEPAAPARPAKLAARAVKKIADGFFGGNKP
jgi:hypothetical protein